MKDPTISLDSPYIDLISAIKDPNVKEIIAKEALQYKPKMEEPKNVKVLENMVEVIITHLFAFVLNNESHFH